MGRFFFSIIQTVTYISSTNDSLAVANGTVYTVNANTSIKYLGQTIAVGLTDVKAMIGVGKEIALGDNIRVDGDVITIVSSAKLTADAAAFQAKIDAVWTKAKAGTLATADLTAVTGLTHTVANVPAYQTAIAALATVDVDTVAELQAVINKVDADILKVAEVAKYTTAANSAAMKALLDAAADGSSNPLGLNMSKYNGLNLTLKNKLSVDMEAIKATLTTVEAIQEAINSL